jgi:poly(3-hydroxybutyrate) depolymerase
VIQGASDTAVASANADALVAQALALNGGAASGTTPPAPDVEGRRSVGGRVVHQADWRVDGRLAARRLRIEGLGHAWCGGDASLDYFDGAPPDATELILDFFAGQGPGRPSSATIPSSTHPAGAGNGH